MQKLHRIALLVVPSIVLAHAACKTDDDNLPTGEGGGVFIPSTTAGAAGAAGKAGSAGKAGTTQAGAAGASGTAGSAGTAGDAGAGGSTAGAGGDAGAGGTTAGAGGTSAGAGGTTAGAGGTSGGTGGTGGTSAGAGGSAAGTGGASCGGSPASVGGGGALSGTPENKAAVLAHLTATCADTVGAGFYDAATPPSPFTSANRGDLVRCAYDRLVTKEEMTAHYVDNCLPNPAPQVGAHKIRVVYWTEREPGKPLLTSASLYIPEITVAANPPLLAIGHGTVGIADKCAPSKEDPGGFHTDWRSQTYALIGHGWPAIVPDFPGIGTPGIGTWMMSLDEGHAMLDGTRVARKMSGSYLSSKNMLVGHSNGGHAALSAQAYASTYGAGGTIDGAVIYAGYWLNNGAWGALLTAIGGSFATDGTISFGMMYTYGHLAAYEGDANAMNAFSKTAGTGGAGGSGGAPTGQARWDAAQDFLENRCWHEMYAPATGPASFGVKKGGDLWTTEYQTDVGTCGLFDMCTPAIAQTWKSRWVADRPEVDKTIPIVWIQGGKDTTIPPNRARCGVDRIKANGGLLTVCGDAEATHPSIVSSQTPWVRDYLAHKLLGAAAPTPCNDGVVELASVTCSVPPPNPTAPGTP